MASIIILRANKRLLHTRLERIHGNQTHDAELLIPVFDHLSKKDYLSNKMIEFLVHHCAALARPTIL
jgi:hypothetical protein